LALVHSTAEHGRWKGGMSPRILKIISKKLVFLSSSGKKEISLAILWAAKHKQVNFTKL